MSVHEISHIFQAAVYFCLYRYFLRPLGGVLYSDHSGSLGFAGLFVGPLIQIICWDKDSVSYVMASSAAKIKTVFSINFKNVVTF